MREQIIAETAQAESEIAVWQERTRPMSERVKEASRTTIDLGNQYRKLIDDWPALELREKGESLRRIFKTVTLYWKPHFHPSSDSPSRPRKTNRAGRFNYELLTDKIGWDFSAPNLCASR